jgi:hypothetical protein
MTFIDSIKNAIKLVQLAGVHYPRFTNDGVGVIMHYLIAPEEQRSTTHPNEALQLMFEAFDPVVIDRLYLPVSVIPQLSYREGGLAMVEQYARSVLVELGHDLELERVMSEMGVTPRTEAEWAREIASRFMVIHNVGIFRTRVKRDVLGDIVSGPLPETMTEFLEWCGRVYGNHYHDEAWFAPDPLIGNEWALELRDNVSELARYTDSAEWVAGWPQGEDGTYLIDKPSTPGQEDFLVKFRRTQELLRDPVAAPQFVSLISNIFNRYLPQRWCVNAGTPLILIVYGANPKGRFMVP